MKHKRYTGHLLISNPSNPDDELKRSVILVVTHTDEIAIGLQINLENEETNLANVSQSVGINYTGNEPLYYGGNMSTNKIHIVHSLDWKGIGTVQLNKEIGVTNEISILTAIAQGVGPTYFKACSGYWWWGESRLDIQLDPRNNLAHEPHKWEIIPANVENVFETLPEDMWQLGIKTATRQKINEWF